MTERIAVVTGAVTGIGRAVAEALTQNGCRVAACDVDEARGRQLEQENPRIRFRKCDVSNENDVAAVVQAVLEDHGRIDILVNNAGIIRRRTGEEIRTEDWDAVFAVNVRGAFLFCKHVTPVMKRQRSGRIINISSIAAKLGDITSAPGYGPSKAAMDALTKTFARELAEYGVTVNGVAPHAIRTEMSAQWSEEKRREVIEAIPLKRLGEPREVAAAVVFLASEDAGFITGEILDVNGGCLMD
ncbi:3-oxoacyl-[acyl-carrier protein] reductase [Desulfacinum infernum DSM 9756]|uniref:3-oxoacyl-[acyl-carrier protein] reductase n=1 Tax=Desulfacinum infernum DSM 9756 TaxID=1121391 RepID=A0A1M5AGU3_9BACT|nr:SDR family NAD(P)-dependent oxidoreductase [Desulfacinum infernum]SHF29356.1 3-oxoacyl-[acyl-carrier protein] reductase [Desulfacinum infernum DSM 9756]